MGCGFGAQLPSVLTLCFPSAFCNCHPQCHELPCSVSIVRALTVSGRQRSSAVVAVVRGRSDAPGKSTESTRSLAPSAQRLLQSCLSCSCQLPTRRNAIISIYRSSAAALHTQPRHTGTPARSPAHKYTGCCRVISITFPSHSHHISITSLPRMPVPE